ncbi:MAG: nucleotidyltransferase domain-containing protein [Candidatus Omnitrophota bacterium]
MAKIIFVSLFSLVLVVIESLGEGPIEDKALRDLKSAIISSLTNNEILIEEQLLTGAEDKTVRTLGCQGKYKLNNKNIMLGCNEDTTFLIDGVAKKRDKNIVEFNGCIKIVTQNGNNSRNIALNDVQVHLTNGEMTTIAMMNPVIEKEIDGEVYLFGSYAKLSFKEISDIDIAVISDTVDKKKFNSFTSKFEKKFGKKIEIHYFSKSFYNNKRDPLVKEILQHGVKLV